MRVAIVGGKLQGVEAAYLAQKAGWEVILIDKDKTVPAARLCDSFRCLDVTRQDELVKVLNKCELIIPAFENKEALASLFISSQLTGIPMLYDGGAYSISSSKIKSNRLFADLGVPAPVPWPKCGFPVILKPSDASGSEGVLKIRNQSELNLQKTLLKQNQRWVIEEYLEGPSYSIEVIGFAGQYKAVQITELEMDGNYDCKRVLAPARLERSLKKQFVEMALKIARSLQLNGIMDVEAILHKGQLKVIEIDARLPSQTPTVVYKSTGLNMLQIIGEAFAKGQPWKAFEVEDNRGVVYEHINIFPYLMEISGEHIMAGAESLQLYNGLFGADEVITDYIPGKKHWVATLIFTGQNRQEAWNKRCQVIQHIREEMGISSYRDTSPYEKSLSELRSM